MSKSQSPEEQLQSILSNVSAGSNLTTGDITQVYKTFVNLESIPKPQGIPQNIFSSSAYEFVGRERDLESLNYQLQGHQQVAITAIEGMGGVGKTELAIQYCLLHLQLNTYPGGICWLRSREQDIGLQIVNFARTDLDLNAPEDLELTDKVYWVWRRWKEGNTLIVFDDVIDFNDIKSYLPPQPSQFKILITTRLKLDLPNSLYLGVLNELDAIGLLSQLVGTEKVEQELEIANELCQRLGYLPLGLQLVGRYVKKRKISLTEELQRLEIQGLNHPSTNITKNDPSWTFIVPRGVAATFELSWEELSKNAQKLGCLLSLFALAPIPWSLVESAAMEHSSEELEDARVELESLHLLQSTITFQLNQLIQEFFRNKQNNLATADEQKSNFCKAIVNIANEIPQTLTLSQINTLISFIPHIIEVITVFSKWLTKEDLIAPFVGLGRFYEAQGAYSQALPWLEKCLSIALERLGKDHHDVASSLNNLAVLYSSQGRYDEAEPLYLQSLEQKKKLLGENHPDIASNLNNLAVLYRLQGRYDEAEPLYLQSLEQIIKLLGEDHPDVASSLNNLATLYYSQGRYDKAEPLYLQSLEQKKKLLGEDHPDVASSLNNLAALYYSQGRYDKAEPLYLQSLEQIKRLLGEDHPDVASSLNNLAALYYSQGRYDEAEPLYLQSLEQIKRSLGEDHPDVASSLNNLAALYYSQGRYDEAEPLYLQVLKINKNLLGNDHPFSINCHQALSTIEKRKNRLVNSSEKKVLNGFNLQYTFQIDSVRQILSSPDNQTIALLLDDNSIFVYDFKSHNINLLIKKSTKILSLGWSPDGQMLASGDDNGTIYIISSQTGNIECTFKQNVFQVISLAWSPNGQLLVSGDDNGKIWFWEIETKRLKNIATVHNGKVKTLVWSSDGKIVASIANDLFINLWDVEKGNVLDKLQGHSDSISSLSWSPSESKFASGSLDRTIYVWDLKTRKPINIIESHTSAVVKVYFSDNGQVLATQSNQGIIKIWKCDNWQLVSVINTNELSGRSDYHPKIIEFHPLKPIVITIDEVSKIINIWKFEFDFIPKIQQKLHEFKLFTRQNDSRELLSHLSNTVHQLSSENDDSIQYINAKVVLIGESGVGKSGLGIRLAEKEFRATESTHGANFWQLPVTQKISSISKLTKVKAELTLWDLAGQPDYHLVHQLFLKNTDIALLLFDCSDTSDPFRGVPYWAKVLKKLTFLRTKKYLVSSRCDVSPVTVSLREINKFLGDYALDHHFQTSAKTGEGAEELLEEVINNIPWDKLLRTTTLQLFQVREFLLEQKEKGEIFIPLDKIISRIERLCLQNPPSKDDINTAVKLLQNSGFVYRLNPTPKTVTVLLRPELINKYASSVIQAARRHPDGIGSIEEREVVCANLPFYEFSERDNLSAWDEKQILESTVELLIDHNLGFREMGRLIFPSQLNIRQEIHADKHPPTEVTYEFSGSVEAIYASLVVCLSYTKDFQREQLWKYAAEFSREGHRLGFAMQQAEGTGELEIYFYEQVTDFDRVTFIRFIQDHLHKKGIDLKERIRLYCPECDEEVKNRKAIEKRVKEGKLQIPCQYCDASVLIPRSIEEKYRSDRAYIEKQKELQATIKERTRQEVIAFREDREQYMSETDQQIRILHLSDIHLGTSDQAKNYFTQLATDLKQNLKVKQLNYLVLSGDIANYSTVEEYDAAFELVDKLVNRYGLNPDRVITVPGNHDLNWDLSEDAYDFVPKRKLSKSLTEGKYIDAGGAGALIRDEERYQQRFKHFSDRFYKKVYGKAYPLEYDQQAILHPCPDDKILFLALNSCWELDHHYKDRASIKSEAISHAVEQILTGSYDDWLKIAVWHHPVTSAESMKKVGFLEQLAVNGFQVAMHGHIHEAKDENFQYDTNRGLRIIAAGTFGAPTKEQVTGIPLQYNLLVLNPDNGELNVETRKKDKVDGAWSADARWGDKENPVKNYTIPLNYGSVKKKSEDLNTSQSNNQPEENPSNNSPNNNQSILQDVQAGGNITIGNITQIYNSDDIKKKNN